MPAQGSLATSGRCFDLKQLYFGCTAANVQSSANVPLPCNITLTAYGGGNRQVGQQNFTFTPSNPLVSNMQVANVRLPPADVILVQAAISVLNLPLPLPTNALTGAVFDNVTYVEYDNNDAGIAACGAGF